MYFSAAHLLLGLFVSRHCSAAPSSSHVIHERRPESLDEWVKLGTIQKSGLLPVRIGLTQQNLDRGHDLLMERSDPKSPKYGQHLTSDEIIDLFAPHDDSVQAVQKWLQSEGIHIDRISRSENRQWIQFHASVEELEQLLHADYDIYENTESGEQAVGADHYSIPKALQEHIDYITPAATKMTIGKNLSKDIVRRDSGRQALNSEVAKALATRQAAPPGGSVNVTDDCTKYMTPRCIRLLYDIPLGTSAIEGNEMGLFEYESYNQKWLSQFFDKYVPWLPSKTRPLISRIDGAVAYYSQATQLPYHGPDQYDDGEAILDVEVAYPITYPQKVRMWDVDDPYYQYKKRKAGFFNTFLDAIDGSYCNRTAFGITGDSPKFDATYPDHHPAGYEGERMCGRFKPTNVISFSYSLFEDSTTVAYQRRQCSEWMKLGLQGVTIVSASGDVGVFCRKLDDGTKVFRPYALSSCPYVVSVGSTQLPKGQDPSTGQETASLYPNSGGGFSNIFPTSEWQKSAVDRYFEENPSPYASYETKWGKDIGVNGGLFNRAGRGFPDVAAVGQEIVTVDRDITELAYGTSASAPIFGAMINRVNEERTKAGMPTVGFINPALYAGADVFLKDVFEGNSGFSCDGKKGFDAAKGWDPVTGLGTPNYPKMLEYFMSINCTQH